MKSKKMLALALFVVLSVSTFATYVSASEPVDDGSSDASSIETTINETRKGCRHGKHGSSLCHSYRFSHHQPWCE